MLRTSPNGRKLIESFEGTRLTAYKDSVGVWTIGVGHTGADVKPGMVITAAQADALLVKDLATAETGVNAAVTVPINQNEFDALVSLAFNVGVGAIKTSTLVKLLNAGDRVGAQAQFKRWNRAGGKVLTGLVRRRDAEAKLFGTPAPVSYSAESSSTGGILAGLKRLLKRGS